MYIRLQEGNVVVEWNDAGQPLSATVAGLVYQIEEQDLRDLHAILGFLYAKPAQ